MKQFLHIVLALFQWIAIILLVLFFGPTTILIGQFDKQSKKWCAGWYRYFCKAILAVTRVKVVVVGEERIDSRQNYLVCANHQGLFDIITMTAALPLPLLFVSKPDFFKIPLFGQAMRASGHLEVTRHDTEHDRHVMDQLADYLAVGRSYVMYPEGTRTRDGSIGPFKMGSFHAAAEAKVAVLPVTIIGSRERMPRGAKWVLPGTVRLIIGEPVPPEHLTPEQFRDRVRDTIVDQYERYAVPLE